MAKLIKTIKQYEEFCTQCGDSFITYFPEKEKLCYQCVEKENVTVHNMMISQMHRDLLNKKVTISNLSLISCNNRNFFNFVQLTDEEGRVFNIGIRSEQDFDRDEYVINIRESEIK
jgi:hypothetical protein